MICRFVLFILILLTFALAEESFSTQCFSLKSEHAVSNSHPIAELFRVTPTDCLNYCIYNSARTGDGCASVVYHREFSTCQLYGHDGNYKGSAVVQANGHDFFARHSWTGACQDKVVPKRGYQQTPKMYGIKLNNAYSKDLRPQETIDDFIATTEVPPTIMKQKQEQQQLQLQQDRFNKQQQELEQQFLQNTSDQKEMEEEPFEEPVNPFFFKNPTHSNVCPSTEKVSYFVLFGYKLAVRQKSSKINGVDQSSCIMYCSQNIDAQGTQVPCFSANYNPIEEKCQLYEEQDRSQRKIAILSENQDNIFVDKFCLKTRKDCSAESPFIVYPFKQIHKKIVKYYPGMNSIVSCVASCIDYAGCQSVTYKQGLCILHSGTPAADSSLLVDGSEETMVVENGCQLDASSVPSMISESIGEESNEPEWGEWSTCKFGVGGQKLRVRHRECDDDCEDMNVEPC